MSHKLILKQNIEMIKLFLWQYKKKKQSDIYETINVKAIAHNPLHPTSELKVTGTGCYTEHMVGPP